MEKKILATIEEAVHNGDTAGANVLVIKDGKESAYCGYGMRDIENRLPIERDTIFRLYSQTKPITAAAAVSLMEKGKLDAGAWLSDYLPEYAVSYVRRNGERVPGAQAYHSRRPAEYDLRYTVSLRGQRGWKAQRRGFLGD